MKKLRLWGFAFLLASTLFLAITQQGKVDSDRTSANTNGMVRLVYFLPNDRPARPDRMAALQQLIKNAQQFYAEQMTHHGFLGKTFAVEMDVVGKPVVHQINGKFNEEYYYTGFSDFKVWEEFLEHFSGTDVLQHVYFIALDLSYEAFNDGEVCGLGGPIFYPAHGDIGFGPPGKAKLRHRHLTQGEEALGGFVLIPASGHCFEDNRGYLHKLRVTTHELGHAFGLDHDFRQGRDSDAAIGGRGFRLSRCAAEWLSVSRFFNTKSKFRNEPGEIQLLSLRVYNQDVISLRFKVTDPDGLHQAQLLVPEFDQGTGWGAYRLFDCKRLNGKTGTVETVVRRAELADRITLQIIDVGGNITWATLPIQLDELVSTQNALDVNSDGVVNFSDLAQLGSRFGQRGKDPADVNEDGVVNIVDLLLVAASSSSAPHQVLEAFTPADVQEWLIRAKQLEVENEILKKGIVELERLLAVLTAVTVEIPDPNLRAAIETALRVSPGTPILSLEMETLIRLEARDANIRNLTGLEHATNLKDLHLDRNAISDISTLAGLTDLTGLVLDENSISDISTLAGLTNLTNLFIGGNNISDISVLAGLTNLRGLSLYNTNISDISAITELTDLTRLWFDWNNISDLSPLVANTGLGRGDEVYVRGNPLSYLSIHVYIPALQSKGVTVEFDADGTRPPDVNGDGNVNVLDLLVIVSKFGDTGTHIATDISGDGVVDILDLVLVAGMFEQEAAAPSAHPQVPETLTAVEVQGWLTEAGALEGRDPIIKRGIMVLEQLLVSLTPTETELLANYPNPFNPETWIPYRLAEDAFVTLTIYDGSSRIVRTLDVGHRIASAYESQAKAIYWDGRNGLGEQVASGVYFYHLSAGDYSATRRMVILK